jgi:hypothetical protein
MTEPVEYADARKSLVAFREKVFTEIVSGRVKALLDANHETLEKYSSVIDGLSVVPYMFGVVKQKALALRLSAKDVGEGEIKQAKLSYVIGKGSYPLDSPFNVATRLLPEVDVFKYTLPTDLGLIEKSNEQMWSNLFVLQCTKGTFIEQADVSNVQYDYYKLRPIGRCKFDVPLLSGKPEFTAWDELDGEATILVRELTKQGETTRKTYDFYVMVDGNYHNVDNTLGVVAIALIVTKETATNTNIVLSAGGKRVETNGAGVFACFNTEAKEIGWAKTHDDYGTIVKTVVWANPVKLTIAVNDVVMGTTSPVPETYDKLSTDEVTVTGYPNSGYTIGNWELDGGQYPASDTFLVKCYSDHTLTCVFIAGGVVTLRPSADGDVAGLYRWGDNAQYKCVDETVSDGDATFVYGDWTVLKYDLYQLPDPSIPSGNVIDYVKLYSRWRRYRRILPCTCKQVLKTNGTAYFREQNNLPEDFEWHIVEEQFNVNPHTGVAWTIGEVNALQTGVACGAGEPILDPADTGLRCTQVWVEVKHHAP